MELTFDECEKCKLFRGTEDRFVKCGRVKEFTVMVPIVVTELGTTSVACERGEY